MTDPFPTTHTVGALTWPDDFLYWLTRPKQNGAGNNWADNGDGSWTARNIGVAGPLLADDAQSTRRLDFADGDTLEFDFDLDPIDGADVVVTGTSQVSGSFGIRFADAGWVASIIGGPGARGQIWFSTDGGFTSRIINGPRVHMRVRMDDHILRLDRNVDGGWVTQPEVLGAQAAYEYWYLLGLYPYQGLRVRQLGRLPAPTATSKLYQRGPDGGYLNVGVDGRPVSMRMPDGSLRTWPGSTAPLYQLGPDGTWRQVI